MCHHLHCKEITVTVPKPTDLIQLCFRTGSLSRSNLDPWTARKWVPLPLLGIRNTLDGSEKCSNRNGMKFNSTKSMHSEGWELEFTLIWSWARRKIPECAQWSQRGSEMMLFCFGDGHEECWCDPRMGKGIVCMRVKKSIDARPWPDLLGKTMHFRGWLARFESDEWRWRTARLTRRAYSLRTLYTHSRDSYAHAPT